MECNRDEATRAKQIAEEKFAAKDIPGAKKFALIAQNLYPELEGLPQMLAAFDVHLSAVKKIFGEPDLYGILGVNPEVNEETVRKQFRKLALMLHPDKNKSIGADGAFKMISEAWSILGNKNKRIQYDQKTILRTSKQKLSSTGQGPSAPPGFSNIASSVIRTQNSVSCPGNSTAASQQPVLNTFWTACNQCNMQYEYVRIYLNLKLLCHSCHKPFRAKETAPPLGFILNPPLSSFQQHSNPNTNQHTSDRKMGSAGFTGNSSSNQTNFHWSPFSKMDGPGGANASFSMAAQATSVVQQAMEKVKREREEAQAAARRLDASRKKIHGSSKRAASNLSPGMSTAASKSDLTERPVKKRSVTEEYRLTLGAHIPAQAVNTNGETSTYNWSGFNQGGHNRNMANVSSIKSKPDSKKELSQIEIRNMLSEKARKELKKKLNKFTSTSAEKATENDARKLKSKEGVTADCDLSVQPKLVGSVDAKKLTKDKKESLGMSDANLNVKTPEPTLISVPDPDFHDFDRNRSERSFGENQVWAAYDDDDGMPRYYALIHGVVSHNPFKIKISWLNSKTNNELGPLNWVGSGFAKTSGDFRVGKCEFNNSLNSFSHRVRWRKGARGAIQIFPRKCDVWALYRNWSPDWNEVTPDEVIHKYDMVEVLDDYNEEQGVNVIPLVKVAGFKAVFHRHLNVKQVWNIPKGEMFRFSHQVPSYLLTGSEGRNAPKGCHELDPAATPLELLQIISEAMEAEMVEPAGEHKRSEADVAVVDTEEETKVKPQKKMAFDAGERQ